MEISTNSLKSKITRFFDKMDYIDRKLYGKRLQYFIIAFLICIYIGPEIDNFISTDGHQEVLFTGISNLLLFAFVFVSTFAWIGSWRDDDGNWTWERTKFKIHSYYESFNEAKRQYMNHAKYEKMYFAAKSIIMAALIMKSIVIVFQIIIFVIMPFGFSPDNSELFVLNLDNYWSVVLFTSLFLFLYIFSKDKSYKKRLFSDLLKIFNLKLITEIEKISINNSPNSISKYNYVYNMKDNLHLTEAKSIYKHHLIEKVLDVLNGWNPNSADKEYMYQDRLFKRLKKALPESNIQTEVPLELEYNGKGRADIVIDNLIMLELKRDATTGAIDRAKGQLEKYSNAWKSGPIFLVLFDFDYEKANDSFRNTMNDFMIKDKLVGTVLVRERKN